MTDVITNPWYALPLSGDFVHPADLESLAAFNQTAHCEHRFDLSLYPEPFLGSPTAPIVVLALNPGWSPQDAQCHAQPVFAEKARRSLMHTLEPYSFLHLQPNADWPGARWWLQRTRELVEATNLKAVATGLLCIEYVPYHSMSYSRRTPALQSQEYSVSLVRSAMAREAEIVVMRSRAIWFNAVPGLEKYKHLHICRSPQAAYLSRRNVGADWPRLLARLQNTD